MRVCTIILMCQKKKKKKKFNQLHTLHSTRANKNNWLQYNFKVLSFVCLDHFDFFSIFLGNCLSLKRDECVSQIRIHYWAKCRVLNHGHKLKYAVIVVHQVGFLFIVIFFNIDVVVVYLFTFSKCTMYSYVREKEKVKYVFALHCDFFFVMEIMLKPVFTSG